MEKTLLSVFIIFLVTLPCAQSANISGFNDKPLLSGFNKEQKISVPHPWPMYRHDQFRTGRSEYNTSTNNGKEKWEFATGGSIVSSPAIDSNGTIYVGSNDEKIYAIYSNGTKKWEFITGGIVTSSPAIDSNGTTYVGGGYNQTMYAIYSNGTKKWEFVSGEEIGSSPVICYTNTTLCSNTNKTEIIYFGSLNHKLYAIYPNGTKRWEFVARDMIRSSPAVDSNGTIYISDASWKLYAVYPSGTKKWEFDGVQTSASHAVGSDGTIYAINVSNLFAIYPNGTKKWDFIPGGAMYTSSPAIGSDGTIYIGTDDNKLYAINPNGTKNWDFITGGKIFSSPAIGEEGTIYISSYEDKKLYAINPNGTKKWEFTAGDKILSSPAIGSDGTIYIGCNNGKLYAIGTQPTPEFTTTIVFVSLSFIAMFILVKSVRKGKKPIQ